MNPRLLATQPAAPAAGADTAWRQRALQVLLFGLVYGAAGRVGLDFSSVAPNVTLIWPPTGISLFVVLRWGPGLWPGIVLGDLIANAGTGASLPATLGISAGNIAQTLLCLWALRRVGFDAQLQRTRDVLALLLLGTAGAAVSACIGPAALWLDGAFAGTAYLAVWSQWWMGDATGVVVLTPWLLAWWHRVPVLPAARRAEAALLLAALAGLCSIVFGALLSGSHLAPGYFPAALTLFPLVVWAALRFGLRGATLVTLLVSVAAVWGTVRGLGPFVEGDRAGSLLRWWLFANVITVTGLLLAASQSERDAARAQAVSDRDFATAVLDAEGAIVVVLDADGRIVRVNRSFELATGFRSAELTGQRFEEPLIPEDERAKLQGHAELLRLKLSEHARLDTALRRRAQPPITVSWTASALRDGAGRMTHAIVSGVDISERVQAAAALRGARRTLEARVQERTRALADSHAALERALAARQQLERELLGLSEREQQRFGQELHDGLGQHLTATAIQAELLARDLERAGHADAQHSAEQIEAMLSDAVAQTRALARGLFPVEIGDGGLDAALRQLAETTTRQTRRRCHFSGGGVEPGDHGRAVHLYRIAQEAVANAIRHAPGADIGLQLQRHGAALELSVRNALPARPAVTAGGPAGIGLRIMRHRAELLGGTVRAGREGADWVVTVRVQAAEPPA